jgi:hypothetical protein
VIVLRDGDAIRGTHAGIKWNAPDILTLASVTHRRPLRKINDKYASRLSRVGPGWMNGMPFRFRPDVSVIIATHYWTPVNLSPESMITKDYLTPNLKANITIRTQSITDTSHQSVDRSLFHHRANEAISTTVTGHRLSRWRTSILRPPFYAPHNPVRPLCHWHWQFLTSTNTGRDQDSVDADNNRMNMEHGKTRLNFCLEFRCWYFGSTTGLVQRGAFGDNNRTRVDGWMALVLWCLRLFCGGLSRIEMLSWANPDRGWESG